MDTTSWPTEDQYRYAYDPGTVMYRCMWAEAGKENKGNIGSYSRANLGMRAKLAQGFAAWIIEVPMTDDDVPF
tara:strand:- start:7726 stop:7944 length:219 start_codon:yes stop_codon:yes gene_type:complete